MLRDIHALKDKQNDSGQRSAGQAADAQRPEHETTYHDSTRSRIAPTSTTQLSGTRFDPKTRGYESHGQASGCKPLPHA